MTESILLTEEYGACEVGNLDAVEVDDIDVAYAEKGEVLDDLIAQCPCSCHQHTGVLHPILLEPGEERKHAFSPFIAGLRFEV